MQRAFKVIVVVIAIVRTGHRDRGRDRDRDRYNDRDVDRDRARDREAVVLLLTALRLADGEVVAEATAKMAMAWPFEVAIKGPLRGHHGIVAAH